MNNPTLLQHGSFELGMGPDLKYSHHDRTYSNLNSVTTNDYLANIKRASAVTNSSIGGFGLEHNTQPLLSDPSFHTSPQYSVSPNDSIIGSTPASGYSTLQTYAPTTLPKPHISHASASDRFNGVPSGVLSSTWGDVAMTAYDQKPSSSFPPSAYSTHNLTNQYLSRASMDHRSYQPPATSLGSSYVNSNALMRPLQSPYSHNGHYYSHDHSYSDVGMSQGESNENKGPGFEDTQTLEKVKDHAGTTMKVDINAAIQKGFFEVDQKWTCYRRNYFTVTCSFQVSPNHTGPFFISHHGQSRQVEGWAVSISAKTAPFNNEASQPRHLVQHTPKRDKKDETVPGKHSVSPQTPQQYQQQYHHQHHQMHHLAHHHHHHGAHVASHDPFYPGHLAGLGRMWSEAVNGEPTPPTQYTFERIQFQKATANNGKRRAQQQFFHIVVELSANIHHVKSETKEWIKVAERVSDPMVVRGRSPGHYKDSHQRGPDRSNHMDDRNGGHGHDNHHMSFGGYSNSGWAGHDTSRGHQPHYSGGTHRSCLSSSCSPPSGGSSATLHGSSTDTEFSMSDSEILKPADLYASPRTSSRDADDTLFSLSRKRALEDDSRDDTSPYQFNTSICETVSSPVLDYPAFPQSKLLCAS